MYTNVYFIIINIVEVWYCEYRIEYEYGYLFKNVYLLICTIKTVTANKE